MVDGATFRLTRRPLLHAAAAGARAEDPEKAGARAAQDLAEGRFEEAADSFATGRAGAGEDYRFSLGLGVAKYRLHQFDQAKGAFMEAAGRARAGFSIPAISGSSCSS